VLFQDVYMPDSQCTFLVCSIRLHMLRSVMYARELYTDSQSSEELLECMLKTALRIQSNHVPSTGQMEHALHGNASFVQWQGHPLP